MGSALVETQEQVSPNSLKVSVAGRFTSLLEKVLERMQKISGIEAKKYSLEEIKDPSIVAGVILDQIQNTIRGRFGENPYENGFSLVGLLSSMGHLPWETSQNYLEELSPEKRKFYDALRITLGELSATEESSNEVKATKPLSEHQFEKPDAYGETIAYKVINPKLLQQITEHSLSK